MGSIEPARQKLQAVGVSRTQIEYLTSSPQRCYWSIFWATMWPAVEVRVKPKMTATRFITGRVDGAVAGRVEDREPPGEWEAYKARLKQEAAHRLLVEGSRQRDRQRWARAPIQVGEGAQPLWATFRGAQREEDLAFLADAVRVELDGGELRITVASGTTLERLARRKSTLVERARQLVPSFPDVQFGRERSREARRAA